MKQEPSALLSPPFAAILAKIYRKYKEVKTAENKKRTPGAGSGKIKSEIFENQATYLAWKQDMARSGKTPEAVIAFYREKGLTDYADRLDKIVFQMERR